MRRRISPEHDNAGAVAEAVALRARLDDARGMIARLEREALPSGTDDQTGLLTYESFRAEAHRELERTRRNGTAVSLVLLDIDGFRTINAAHGAAGGDAALQALTSHVQEVAREGDVIGRTGADEVALLMLDTDLEGALACAHQLVDRVAVQALHVDGMATVTVSAGAAVHIRGGSVETLLQDAASGLGRARQAGGSRVEAGTASDPAAGYTTEAHPHIDVIEALAATLLERDQCTGEHSRSVVSVARGVAGALGLQPADIERVSAAALLHDIGKVAVPDHILNKPGALDDAEWAIMRQHPVVGERILRAIPGLAAVAHLIRHEHEFFDGSGYPDGLKGEEIPIGSRIILACDTYHSMTSDRPYRSRLRHADAVHELARCAGTQFDPVVTEALIGHLHGLRQIAH